MANELAFYTVANAAHFPGAVALLNSLRLVGETAPLYVVDCGLTPSQRGVLSAHATLVPQLGNLHPMLQKPTGPLAHPAEVMVVLDADMIVTRRLTPLIEETAAGRIVLFENDLDRFFPEWSTLGLGDPHYFRYVCSAPLFLPFSPAANELLHLLNDSYDRVDGSATIHGGAKVSSPFFFVDQDILNAILCTRYGDEVVRLEHRLAPMVPFTGLRVSDRETLTCVYADGVSPYLLHHVLRKPWLAATKANPYTELFTRVTFGSDVPIRLAPHDVPVRLRPSSLAGLDWVRVSMQAELSSRVRGRLGIREALSRGLAERRIR